MDEEYRLPLSFSQSRGGGHAMYERGSYAPCVRCWGMTRARLVFPCVVDDTVNIMHTLSLFWTIMCDASFLVFRLFDTRYDCVLLA